MPRLLTTDIMLLMGRLRLAFQERTGAASLFGILAWDSSIGTWIWTRDYASSKQRLLGRVPTSLAVRVLTMLVEDLRGLRRREEGCRKP